jgi:hypothetical protein
MATNTEMKFIHQEYSDYNNQWGRTFYIQDWYAQCVEESEQTSLTLTFKGNITTTLSALLVYAIEQHYKAEGNQKVLCSAWFVHKFTP